LSLFSQYIPKDTRTNQRVCFVYCDFRWKVSNFHSWESSFSKCTSCGHYWNRVNNFRCFWCCFLHSTIDEIFVLLISDY